MKKERVMKRKKGLFICETLVILLAEDKLYLFCSDLKQFLW